MTVGLSDKTRQLVNLYFPDEGDSNIVSQLLTTECGSNIPLCNSHSPEDMERIRFAVLKQTNGDISKFDLVLNLAKTDWRDLLMAADFGHNLRAHITWYEEIIANPRAV